MGPWDRALTVAAALDTGVITPSTMYTDTGCLTISTKKVCNFDGKPRGRINNPRTLQKLRNADLNSLAKLGIAGGKCKLPNREVIGKPFAQNLSVTELDWSSTFFRSMFGVLSK